MEGAQDVLKIRALHPEFFSDAKIALLPFDSRLLFAGLWCHSDDYGRGRWLPKTIEGEVFPRDTVDIERMLTDLREEGLIVRYADNKGDFYYFIPNWDRYQTPKYKAKTSVPEPTQFGTNSEPIRNRPGNEPARQAIEEEEVIEEAAASPEFFVFHKERALTEVRSRRNRGLKIRSESGLAAHLANDPAFLAESTRIYEHRTCTRCRGKGSIDLHAPGGDATINCPGEEQ